MSAPSLPARATPAQDLFAQSACEVAVTYLRRMEIVGHQFRDAVLFADRLGQRGASVDRRDSLALADGDDRLVVLEHDGSVDLDRSAMRHRHQDQPSAVPLDVAAQEKDVLLELGKPDASHAGPVGASGGLRDHALPHFAVVPFPFLPGATAAQPVDAPGEEVERAQVLSQPADLHHERVVIDHAAADELVVVDSPRGRNLIDDGSVGRDHDVRPERRYLFAIALESLSDAEADDSRVDHLGLDALLREQGHELSGVGFFPRDAVAERRGIAHRGDSKHTGSLPQSEEWSAESCIVDVLSAPPRNLRSRTRTPDLVRRRFVEQPAFDAQDGVDENERTVRGRVVESPGRDAELQQGEEDDRAGDRDGYAGEEALPRMSSLAAARDAPKVLPA